MGSTGTPGDLVKMQVWAQWVWGGTQGFSISSQLQDAEDHAWRNKVAVMLTEEKEVDMSSPGQGLYWALPLLSFSCSVMSDSLQPHRLQHTRLCPSPTPRAYSNSCPLSPRCHPTISPSVVPFSPCLQSFPASGSFQMSQLFTSGGESTGVSASASVFPMNIQD